MNPSNEFIRHICDIYNDYYDDRIEESNPPTAGNNPKTAGEDWRPGVAAAHKSLVAFQKELEEEGIRLSTSKIKKILVTGGCWTTARSRQVQELYEKYTKGDADSGFRFGWKSIDCTGSCDADQQRAGNQQGVCFRKYSLSGCRLQAGSAQQECDPM